MSVTPSTSGTSPQILQPSVVGTSAKYTGGRPFAGYLLLYCLAAVGIFAIWGAISSILLPNHVQAIEFSRWFTGADASVDLQALNTLKAQVASGAVVPTGEQQRLLGLLADFDAARAQSLSVVTSIGVFVTMFVQPIAGVLSDRTRSVWGRRAPWIAGGAVLGALLLIGMRYSSTIVMIAILWSVAQLVINVAQGPLTATVADRVAEQKLGAASAISGLGSMGGAIVGSVAAGLMFAHLGLDTYYPYAIALAVLCLLFVLVQRDRSSKDLDVAPLRWGEFLRSLVVPLKDADFRWVWIAKITLFFGYTISGTFGFYMLQSYIQPALSAQEATRLAPIMALVGFPGMLAAMLVAGRWSDKIGRRKPFVIWTSVVMASSMLIPFVWPTLPGLFVQAVIGGVAMGAYLVVDQALFIDVLLDKRTAGRDLGMGALGGNFGQAIGPVVAGQVVALTGGYAMVWLVSAVIVLIAAVAIVPVKRAR
jgi:MFS family permease